MNWANTIVRGARTHESNELLWQFLWQTEMCCFLGERLKWLYSFQIRDLEGRVSSPSLDIPPFVREMISTNFKNYLE